MPTDNRNPEAKGNGPTSGHDEIIREFGQKWRELTMSDALPTAENILMFANEAAEHENSGNGELAAKAWKRVFVGGLLKTAILQKELGHDIINESDASRQALESANSLDRFEAQILIIQRDQFLLIKELETRVNALEQGALEPDELW